MKKNKDLNYEFDEKARSRKRRIVGNSLGHDGASPILGIECIRASSLVNGLQ